MYLAFNQKTGVRIPLDAQKLSIMEREEIIELLHSERFNEEKPLALNYLKEYATDFQNSYLGLYEDAFYGVKERFFEDVLPVGNWYADDLLDENGEVIEEKEEEFLRSDDFLSAVEDWIEMCLETTVEAEETDYDNPWGNSPLNPWNINEESGRTEINPLGCLLWIFLSIFLFPVFFWLGVTKKIYEKLTHR